MARKKHKSSRRPAKAPARSEPKKGPTPSKATTKKEELARPPGREIRPYVYAAFDLGMAVLWATLLCTALSNRHGWSSALLWSMVVFAVVMCAAMFVRSKWGWRAAVASCGALLLLWLLVIITLVMSAAYLSGVYGAFGRAAAMGALAIGALTVELVALVPALQLKFLMTRAGRRYFRQEPLRWR